MTCVLCFATLLSPNLGLAGSKDAALRGNILRTAKGWLNTPYRYGGSAAKGVDCSAFTQRVFADNGIKIPRTVKKQAAAYGGVWVKKPLKGDLVFFKNTYKRGFSHVGIYAGNNKMIHASVGSGVVEEASLDNPYFRKHFAGFRRFVGSGKSANPRRYKQKRTSAPFWIAATGLVAGVVGGLFSEGTENKLYFAGGGALLFGIGVTWGHSQKVSIGWQPPTSYQLASFPAPHNRLDGWSVVELP